MKKQFKYFFVALMGLSALFCSCGDDDKDEVPVVEATSITLSEESITVKVGSTVTLKATVAPSNAKYKLIWSSDDKAIAKVSEDGEVKGVSEGKAVVKVKTDNGLFAKCQVSVVAKTSGSDEEGDKEGDKDDDEGSPEDQYSTDGPLAWKALETPVNNVLEPGSFLPRSITMWQGDYLGLGDVDKRTGEAFEIKYEGDRTGSSSDRSVVEVWEHEMDNWLSLDAESVGKAKVELQITDVEGRTYKSKVDVTVKPRLDWIDNVFTSGSGKIIGTVVNMKVGDDLSLSAYDLKNKKEFDEDEQYITSKNIEGDFDDEVIDLMIREMESWVSITAKKPGSTSVTFTLKRHGYSTIYKTTVKFNVTE